MTNSEASQMTKLYIAMFLLYGGALLAGLSTASFWIVIPLSGIFLAYLARSRPSVLSSSVSILTTWFVQIILASIVYGLGYAIISIAGFDLQVAPLFPILISACAVLFAYVAKLPTAADLESLDAFLDDAIDQVQQLEKDDD